jgi:hydrogenase nickel incorporation protein HypB
MGSSRRDPTAPLPPAPRPKRLPAPTACHLDAALVHDVLHRFPCEGLDYLFIENVGNLVCPALYDLGQDVNVVALSVTEGEDKPLKYPVMFRTADVVLITKTDLLPHLPEVSPSAIADALARVMPDPRFFPISVRTGEGLELWISWLEARRCALPGRTRSVAPAFGMDRLIHLPGGPTS